ncbi:acetamidase/formamidase family protein [Bacillus sp. FJAT-49736]|uniref:acetamidase/formamidase family protein n=1 Tax=Bacillus sp. FJAT-49736 TaxID=2833582 RepID=UPI001BC9D605|nr:acetamidase/formamidase family protein [Bacillus sp. FJAT-49736]MBS4172323.1 acetamidase/formamidase family protein [Bacillus sp. FJAT-49736]
MKFFEKKHYITSFTAENKPKYYADLGEAFQVETHDCYGGAFTSESQLRTSVDLEYINPATGPIYINGVKKGDILCVDILNIELDSQGVMVLYPGMGTLGEKVKVEDTKIIPVNNGIFSFNQDLQFSIMPMIGVIGVAPLEGKISCESPGDHGGNMDTKYITTGNKVYLPVFHDGGLLALGDLHASMGDGELDGSGIEIGGKVTIKVTKLDDKKLSLPIVETKQSIMFIASEKTVEKASKKGMLAAIEAIMLKHSLTFNDAYRLLSAMCDIQISQLVNPLVTVRINVPKQLLI